MTGFLRWLGILNAAVWFGAAILFTFAIQPAVFSEEMKQVLGGRNYPFFSQAISDVLSARFFHLTVACAVVAFLHLAAERLYLGKNPARLCLGLLIALLALSLFGSGWIQPRLKASNALQHGVNTRPEQRQAAADSLVLWRRFFRLTNLLMLGGVAFYLWRAATPSEPPRFASAAKFRS